MSSYLRKRLNCGIVEKFSVASQTIKAATRAATEMNDPAEVDRIIAAKQRAQDAENALDNATERNH